MLVGACRYYDRSLGEGKLNCTDAIRYRRTVQLILIWSLSRARRRGSLGSTHRRHVRTFANWKVIITTNISAQVEKQVEKTVLACRSVVRTLYSNLAGGEDRSSRHVEILIIAALFVRFSNSVCCIDAGALPSTARRPMRFSMGRARVHGDGATATTARDNFYEAHLEQVELPAPEERPPWTHLYVNKCGFGSKALGRTGERKPMPDNKLPRWRWAEMRRIVNINACVFVTYCVLGHRVQSPKTSMHSRGY